MSLPSSAASWDSIPRCLQVGEILLNIIEQAYDGGDGDLATLAALAQTCRAFLEPALDAIWRTLHNIEHLVMTMSQDTWSLIAEEDEQGQRTVLLAFERDPTPEDWARFGFYAKRVRSLRHTRDFERVRIVIPDEVWGVLAQHQPTTPLLPSLRKLVWPTPQIPWQYFPLVIGPSLQSVSIFLQIGQDDPASFMSRLAVCAASVEDINIRLYGLEPYEFTDTFQIALLHAVQHMPRLRTFQCPPSLMSTSLCALLASSTSLVSLNCGHLGDSRLADCALPPTPYPALEALNIYIAKLSAATTLLSSMDESPLRSISLSARNATSPRDLREFAERVACYPSTLRTLTVGDQDEAGPRRAPAGDRPAPLSALRPLHALQNLRAVDLHFSAGLGLTDACLAEMATWWPRIERLTLANAITPAHTVTLRGCIPIAVHCPHIGHLALTVDAQGRACTGAGRPAGGVENRSLYMIDVHYSQLDDPTDAALFLSDLFPDLADVFHRLAGDMAANWELVPGFLAVARQARQQERQWARSRMALAAAAEEGNSGDVLLVESV